MLFFFLILIYFWAYYAAQAQCRRRLKITEVGRAEPLQAPLNLGTGDRSWIIFVELIDALHAVQVE